MASPTTPAGMPLNFKNTKTIADERIIVLAPSVLPINVTLLQQSANQQPRERVRAGSEWRDCSGARGVLVKVA